MTKTLQSTIHRSHLESIDPEPTFLPELVLRAAARAPERTALVDAASGAAVSYGTLAERVDRVAAGLAARGFGPGDVLALWAPNLPPWAGVALGAMRAGGAVTGVPMTATERELAGQLADSGASVLVTLPAQVEAARAVGARDIVVVGEAPGATPIAALLAEEGPAPEGPQSRDAVAALPYSSGTTGLPKGVMLTHANLAAAVAQISHGMRADDTVLAVAPYAHVMGFVASLSTPLTLGATVVTLPRFGVDALVDALERHRVTVLIGPPPIAAALASHPALEDRDLSALELVVCGGAALSPERQRALAERLPRAIVTQAYGMTETSTPLTAPERERPSLPGSVGRLAASTELRVVDPESGRDVGPGERGELWTRGPQNTPGYLGRPDATAALIDEDGWLHTGDLGWIDDDGNLYVVDRLKELIKVNALQVAPAELEALLVTHPTVADAAVVGRPDERAGERPVAVVVAREPIDPEALMAWLEERVAPHKRLAEVRFVEQIPRTPSGKILRRLLA